MSVWTVYKSKISSRSPVLAKWAPGSASVKLALRCCTCVFAGRNIRKKYCQIRLPVAFSSILVLTPNTFVYLRMFLIHSRWREALIVEGHAIKCRRLASTLAWDKVLFHLGITPSSSLQHVRSVFSCYLERLKFCSKKVVAISNKKALLSRVNILPILTSHGFQELCAIFRFVSSDVYLTVWGFNNKLKYRWCPLCN